MHTTTNYNLKKPEDSDFAKIEDINDNMDIIDAAMEEISSTGGEHGDAKVNSAAGVHGLRYYDGEFSVKVGNDWSTVKTGGGSIITVTTQDSEFYGKTVTLSDGNTSLTGTMDNNGKCVFESVELTGTLTATIIYDGDSFTSSTTVSYFGQYEIEISIGPSYTLNITTTETTLYNQSITITNGTKTKTASFDASGSCTTVIHFSGTVQLTSTDGTDTAKKKITVTAGTSTYNVRLNFAGIYGVSWDGSSTQSWTRTDDAEDFTDPTPAVSNGNGSSPFDEIEPWSEMVTVDDAECGKMVKIPKFYYKWTQSGSTLKLQVSKEEQDGFEVCPACADRDGSGERDYVLVGRYHCAASTYKSTSGVAPQVSKTRAEFRSAIHNLGSNVWQYDIATHITIWMLYLVEYANWDSQKKIGYGCAPTGSTSAVRTMGYTDGMVYHTGTDQADRTSYGGTQYRHIEGLWDNCYDWCDGIYFSDTNIYVTKNPANFSDTSGGTLVGTRANAGGYIKSMKVSSVTGFKWFLYPDDCTGATEDSYVGDSCSYNASGVVLFVGGHYSQYRNRGLFFLHGDNAASIQSTDIGSRLLKIPSAS